ncbi:hypothetical protein [Egicoccus halophilus]|uniref:hypothetical protein n=1 Tax=Egicoccus halophilus TaxID=1670830 RepID=UPI001031FFF8|nr:hypothetical protein [Egicoccus halophilus]
MATITALLGVVVTFFFNIRSNRLTRQGLDQDRELARQRMEQDQAVAEATATRSERAAEVAEEHSSRIVDALEKIAASGSVSAHSAPASKVRWQLRHEQGDRYRLTNEGDLTAHTVELDTDETLPLHALEGDPDEVGPGEALSFIASTSMHTRDRTLTVTWAEANTDHRQRWRNPLPPRPSRRA